MNNMWKKIFVLLSGYVSFIAFAVLGGLIWYKNEENEEIKKTVKLTLIISLIFTAISALLGLYNYIGSLWSHYYSTDAYEAYGIISSLVSIAKIIVFAVFIIRELVNGLGKKESATTTNNNKSTAYSTSNKPESVDADEVIVEKSENE